MLVSVMGALVISMVNGYEHPPIGTVIEEGIVTGTGVFVTRMLLFFVMV